MVTITTISSIIKKLNKSEHRVVPLLGPFSLLTPYLTDLCPSLPPTTPSHSKPLLTMGSTRGKRVPGKKKPKSIKAKVTSKMSSKRRLSRMGKEMKKGMKGIVANYMTRSQVLRRLQITLRDFRYVHLSL